MNNNDNNDSSSKLSLDQLEKNHRRRLASIRNRKTEHMHVFDQEEKILEILSKHNNEKLTAGQIAAIIGISRYSIYNRLVDLEKKGKIKSYKEKMREYRIVVRYWYYHCCDEQN